MDLLLAVMQSEPQTVHLDRIADSLRWLTWAMLGVTIVAVIVGAFAIHLLLTVRRVAVAAERRVQALSPLVIPTLDRARTVVDESARIVHGINRRVENVGDTVDDVNESLREAAAAVEVRLKEFVAVLDIVREETQDLLLDGAATAHGVHTAAARLRAPAPGRAIQPEPPPPIPDEVRRTSHGQG